VRGHGWGPDEEGEAVGEFRVEASFEQATGRVVAAYFSEGEGTVKETKEIEGGVVYADYDRLGRLVGGAVLGACEVGALARVAENEPEPVRRFLRDGLPCGLIAPRDSGSGQNNRKGLVNG
jgi:hypothetical protein